MSEAPRSPAALVTGGAVRVGRALSLGLADEGWDVAVGYHASEAPAREVAQQVEAAGHRALLCPGDVSDPGDVGVIADRIRQELGRLDLLVNNASTFFRGRLAEVSEEEWDRTMGVNVKGPFLLVRALADLLAASRGSVVNVLDLSAFRPWVEYPHHSVSKAALLQLTKVMARSLAPEIRVNAVAPGTVLPPEDYSEDQIEASRRKTLLKALGTPEDVVRAVLFLARSPFVTGEVIVVDGGRRLAG
ncbi:MAG TPA: SDR family oxidoreductase [Longimicrobiales bacterium]|nr:SDR family oxidoreductase [Longimicrobiales bacterium]